MAAIIVPAVDVVGNILVDCEAITPTSEDSNFPSDFLADGEIGALFRFAAAAANDAVLCDLNRLRNGGFEDWGVSDPLPAGWIDDSSGTGIIERETTIVNAGGSTVAAKLTGGGAGNEARLRRSILVLPGWAMTISLAIRGGSGTALLYILNEETGKYLISNETWSATKTAYGTEAGASYSAEGTPANFTIEAASVGLRGVNTLRCWAEVVTGTGYVDDWFIWPHWDFAAVFGHNLGANIAARVRSDNNPAMSSPSNQVAFSLRRPSMFGVPATMVTERYAQFYDEGTNPLPGEKGELVLAQKLTLPRATDLPYGLTPSVGLTGGIRPVSVREDESMSIGIKFKLTEADWDDMRVRLFDATRWGGRRMVLVPQSTRGDIYYGTFIPVSVERMRPGNLYLVSGDFEELEYAVRTT